MTVKEKYHECQLSIVVPCYNEDEVIPELYQRITKVCKDLEIKYELILVNDGSTDRTWILISELSSNDSNVLGVSLSRNYGHQIALTAGLSISIGERILIIDADLQDPPELLPEMMRLMDEGADLVYGERAERQGETWLKKFSAALFYRLLNLLSDINIPQDTGDFRLINRRVLEVLNAMPERHRFIRGMVSWAGFKQVALTYEREARFAGETKYPFKKMLRFAIDAITSFSVRPLKIASFLGILFGMLGFGGLTYTMVSWISGRTVPGWTSVIATIMILGSIQLFVIGIFGEYLGRLYVETKRRPLFIIDRIICQRISDSHIEHLDSKIVIIENIFSREES
jgi:polyisoprenyl-phosphate glycosyltransferase